MTKKGPIHSTNNEKQLPDVAIRQIWGHAKSLLTVCWDVIRLIWKWNRVRIHWQIFTFAWTMTESYFEMNNIYLLVNFKWNEPFLVSTLTFKLTTTSWKLNKRWGKTVEKSEQKLKFNGFFYYFKSEGISTAATGQRRQENGGMITWCDVHT